METVDILTIVDGLDDLLLIDMLRQRQLYDEAVDIVVLIQFIHTSQEFGLGDVILKTDKCGLEATSLAREYLIFNVSLRTTVVTYQHCCQMGLFATTSHNLLYLFGNLSLNGCCCCFSVN